MMFRKFLLGQCNKLLLTQVPFNDCNLSSKKLFDDTYLFFMEQHNTYHKNLAEVALGSYELINYDMMPGGFAEQVNSLPVAGETNTEVFSNSNTQIQLTTQINFGFGAMRNELETAGN
jgi:hypothetical protein